jgi:predicted transposase YbfD/YdcC
LPASAEKRDGCIVERRLKVAPIDAQSCGFPHAAQVIEEERSYLHKETGEILTDAKTGQPKIFIRHFITSLRPGEADGRKLAELIRNHWGVENRNHWRRDASRWKEDACRLRNPQAAQNFALLRNALLALIPPESGTMEQIFERYTLSSAAALKLLNSKIRNI